jgi:O-antigen/teichoic acid export membrane protein
VNIRRLLSSTALYGAADALVLLVGGFLLLPFYTRTLSQAEFGQFVVIRAGIELLTYLLHFGLLSAVARLFFDQRELAARREYMASVIMMFVLILGGWAALAAGFGEEAWHAVVPGAPAQPYLWLSIALAVVAFFGNLASTWLRLDARVWSFVALQVTAAAALATAAFVNLSVLTLGLHGLVLAMFAGPLVTAAVLPVLFGRHFRPRLQRNYTLPTLHYALPAVASLVAYFVLNRIGIVILQRHATLDEIAVFGLVQQLAMLVTLTGVAFGKSMQPAVFGATAEAVQDLMRRFGRILLIGLASITVLLMLFGSELLALIAPVRYRAGHGLFLILAFSAFAYALGLLADTVLLHGRRPRMSALLTLCGAMLSTLLGLLLIPRYAALGAALAMASAFLVTTLVGQVVAARLTGLSFLRETLSAIGLVAIMAVFAHWLHGLAPQITPGVFLAKVLLTGALTTAIYKLFLHGDYARMKMP